MVIPRSDYSLLAGRLRQAAGLPAGAYRGRLLGQQLLLRLGLGSRGALPGLPTLGRPNGESNPAVWGPMFAGRMLSCLQRPDGTRNRVPRDDSSRPRCGEAPVLHDDLLRESLQT